MYSSAVAAGADFGSPSNSLEAAQRLVEGITGSEESGFGNTEFRVNLTEDLLRAALSHLEFDGSGLNYKSD